MHLKEVEMRVTLIRDRFSSNKSGTESDLSSLDSPPLATSSPSFCVVSLMLSISLSSHPLCPHYYACKYSKP